MFIVELVVSYQNNITGKGCEQALAGMVIVIVDLTMISGIVALLPVLLKVLAKFHPEKEKLTAKKRKSDTDEGLIAAIAFAKHSHLTNSNS